MKLFAFRSRAQILTKVLVLPRDKIREGDGDDDDGRDKFPKVLSRHDSKV